MTLTTLTQARTFRSLRGHRNYRLWFGGQVVSMTGTWVQNVAQAWFIVALTRSPLALGFLAVCQFGPYFLLGLVGGSVVDRLDNRRILISTQLALMVSAAVITALALSGVAQPWHIYVIAAFNGAVSIIDTPARQAFTMQMVGRDELPNAVALNASLFNASRVMGPAIGGLLIATAGIGICFLVNAWSFLAVLSALLAMNPKELIASRRRGGGHSLLRESAEGIAYCWRTPRIRLVGGMMLLVGTFAINFNVLLPVLTQRTLNAGPSTFGWISAAFGGGALIGALVSATIGRASRNVLLAGCAAFGLSQLALAWFSNVWACAALLVCCGIAFSLYTSMTNSTIQLVVPDRLRGRVMGIYGYVFFGTAPIGGLIAGALAEQGGTLLAFGVGGLVAVAVAVMGTAATEVSRRSHPERPETMAAPEVSMVRE